MNRPRRKGTGSPRSVCEMRPMRRKSARRRRMRLPQRRIEREGTLSIGLRLFVGSAGRIEPTAFKVSVGTLGIELDGAIEIGQGLGRAIELGVGPTAADV